MFDFISKFTVGLSYQDFLRQYGNDDQRQRWQQVHAQVQLTDGQRQLLTQFTRRMKVLCIAGAWCGDCVNQCPIFDHFASACDRIELRFVDRDAWPDLTAAVKICGGARVPTVIFLSEDDHFCGVYGDRTLAKYREVIAKQQGAACPTGIGATDTPLLAAVTQEWLDEFERIQWMLRTSARLRQLHGD